MFPPWLAQHAATLMTDQFNQKHGTEQITFSAGAGGLPKADIRNELGSAEIYLHGAHITSFQPGGRQPVLWMSEIADFSPPKPIRGGIPICWPWFGPHPTDADKPAHGFVRNREWQIEQTRDNATGSSTIVFSTRDDEETRKLWDHAFDLSFKVTVGRELRVDLCCTNTGSDAIDVGAALHTYFGIEHIDNISINGLDGRKYHDQLAAMQIVEQSGDITIGEEVDRIYTETNDTCVINDPGMNRKIRVAKEGSSSTVVWNPWIAKAGRMPDYPNEGYKTMVCIETTNAAGDVRSIAPGDQHTITQIVSVE